MILDDEDILIKKSENNLNLLAYLLFEGYCDYNKDNRNSLHRFLNRILKNYNFTFNYGSIRINSKKNITYDTDVVTYDSYIGNISYGFNYFKDASIILNIYIHSEDKEIFNIFSINESESELYHVKSTNGYYKQFSYIFNEKKKTP